MVARAYDRLVEIFHRLDRIHHAMTFLQWDQLVMMPPGGNSSRAASLAEMASLYHELLTGSETGELLLEAKQQESDPALSRSLLEMEREWRQAECLPASLVKAKSLAGSTCEHGWRSQRKENDWTGFLVNFKEVVKLSREEARLRQEQSIPPMATPYDAMLDLYCTGDSSEFINSVFTQLKTQLPELLAAIIEQQQIPAFAGGKYPVSAQQQLNRKLMDILGFDFNSGRLDVSMHPFSTGDRGDQRITTRFTESGFVEALQGTAHETGHASYEAGLPAEWQGLPVGKARNMCIHESQSLLFEKQIFLSLPFCRFFHQFVTLNLPEVGALGADQLWQQMTRVKPSFIRVDADEVTYPLHVILRFEIESALINGSAEPENLPEMWDEKMQRYLGLSTRDNYTDGCLQDIHWTDGSFGYFPSYTLGALNSAQLFAAVKNDNPEWEEMLGRGEVAFVREWLSDKVWSVASTRESQEIIQGATGEGTNPEFFLEHLRARYLESRY